MGSDSNRSYTSNLNHKSCFCCNKDADITLAIQSGDVYSAPLQLPLCKQHMIQLSRSINNGLEKLNVTSW